MYVFELRRVYRQYIRNRRPIGDQKIKYTTVLRRKMILNFCLFFAGWCFVGHLAFNTLFFEKDPETGLEVFIPPSVVKQRTRKLREDYYNSFKRPEAIALPFDD